MLVKDFIQVSKNINLVIIKGDVVHDGTEKGVCNSLQNCKIWEVSQIGEKIVLLVQ